VALGGDGAALEADQVSPADRVAAFLVRQIRDTFSPRGNLDVHRGLLPVQQLALNRDSTAAGIAPNRGIGESRQ
jgi:hypothetical protein